MARRGRWDEERDARLRREREERQARARRLVEERERAGWPDWFDFEAPEPGWEREPPPYPPRHVDEPLDFRPIGHRYFGYEDGPHPFHGPRGTGGGGEDRLTYWDAGFLPGPPGYTGWGIERFGNEPGFGGWVVPIHYGRVGGTGYPGRLGRSFLSEFPSERTAPRRGRGPRGYQRPDERIHEDVNERLMRTWMDASDVEVRVELGEVTLLGYVDTRDEKRAVEDVACAVRGVKDVHNRLRVDADHRLRDQERAQEPPPSRH